MSVKVNKLHRSFKNLLNAQEQGEIVRVLTDYNNTRNLGAFVRSLAVLLDTPAKKSLLPAIRNILPKGEQQTFDELMAIRDARASVRTVRSHTAAAATTDGGGSTRERRENVSPRATKAVTTPQNQRARHVKAPDQTPSSHKTRNKTVRLERSSKPSSRGLGFSIRGGSDHHMGIYVSHVDHGSVAALHGVMVGDQLISVNGVSFDNIAHDAAVEVIKRSSRLTIELRDAGHVPATVQSSDAYVWVDPNGHTVSPPPEADNSSWARGSRERRSGFTLLQHSDERKVNIMIPRGKTLGIRIRGGSQFGLGIFITHVDKDSVAERAGLQVGDKILDINGKSCLDITHNDAAVALKSSSCLILTLKDVGKLPYARSTYDHAEWASGDDVSLQSTTESCSSIASKYGNHNDEHETNSIFRQGVGSQLMHNKLSNERSKPALSRQTGNPLTTEEKGRLTRHVQQYLTGYVCIEELVMSLFQLLDTDAKYSLMADVRKHIAKKDLETFDYLVLERKTTQIDGDDISDNLGEAIKQIRGSTRYFKRNPSPHRDAHPQQQHHQKMPSRRHENNLTEVEVYPVPKNSLQLPITDWNEDKKLDLITVNRTKQTTIENSLKDIDLNEYCRTKKKPNSGGNLQFRSTESKHRNTLVNSDITDNVQNGDGKWTTGGVMLNNKSDSRLFRANSVPHSSGSAVVHHNKSTTTDEDSDHTTRQKYNSANDITTVIEPPTPFRSQEKDVHEFRSIADGPSSSMGGQPGRYSDRTAGRRVVVPKTKPTLGISIEGGADTKQPFPRIIKIQRDGSAFDSQALQVGDILLSVNGQHIYGMEHRVCARTIAQAFKTSQVLELFIANDHDRSTIE